jgi:hypothetical protein
VRDIDDVAHEHPSAGRSTARLERMTER